MTDRPTLTPSEVMEPCAYDIAEIVDHFMRGECIRTRNRDYWLADVIASARERGLSVMDDGDTANALLSSDIDPIEKYRERGAQECRIWLEDTHEGRRAVAQWLENQREIEE